MSLRAGRSTPKITLTSRKMAPLNSEWRVFLIIEHKYVSFSLDGVRLVSRQYRNFRNTNWSRYCRSLQSALPVMPDQGSMFSASAIAEYGGLQIVGQAHSEKCLCIENSET